MKLKLKNLENNQKNGERLVERRAIYYTNSKLRIFSFFRPKNSNF